MQDARVTRVSGSDIARLDGPTTGGRVDAAHPEGLRPEPGQAVPSIPGPSRPSDGADADGSRPRPAGKASPAAFPTSYARFSIDAETQQLSIKIVDAVTDQVIREIPAEEVQRIAEDLQSLARRASIGKHPAGGVGTARIAGVGVDRYV